VLGRAGECSCGVGAGCDETGIWRESGNHGLEPQSSLRHSLGVSAEHQSIGTRRSNRVCDHRELHVVCRWKRQIFIVCLLTHAHELKHACTNGLVCPYSRHVGVIKTAINSIRFTTYDFDDAEVDAFAFIHSVEMRGTQAQSFSFSRMRPHPHSFSSDAANSHPSRVRRICRDA
jgi:hypothetical protein